MEPATLTRQDFQMIIQGFQTQVAQLSQANAQLSQANIQLSQANQILLERNQRSGNSESSNNLKEFKITSVKPPTFDGNLSKKKAHEIQKTIDEYLHNSESQAKLYGFKSDDDTSSIYFNHVNYTAWITTGLTGIALSAWRKLDSDYRDNMSWNDYKRWIQKTFGSQLTLEDATLYLKNLTQKHSCRQYTEEFNDLTTSLLAYGIDHSEKYLCIIYRQGLKPHLSSNIDLFKIDDDIKALQQQAERLDEFYWARRSQKPYGNSEKAASKFSSKNFGNNFQDHNKTFSGGPTRSFNDPMDLSNLQDEKQFQRLTIQEKELYRKNGWCTFCRDHDHLIETCPRRPKRNGRPTQNSNGNNGSNRSNGNFSQQQHGINNRSNGNNNGSRGHNRLNNVESTTGDNSNDSRAVQTIGTAAP